MLKITEAAQREIAFRLKGQEQKYIRVYIEKSGCAGPSFSMVFDFPRETDDVYHINGLAYLVDRQLMQQVQYIEVDFGPCKFRITSGSSFCRGCSSCGSDCPCHS